MTLLVATDFSPASLNAVNYAINLATALNAHIVLTHVYNLPVPISSGSSLALSMEELKHSSGSMLEELKARLIQSTAGSLNISTDARMGDKVDELVKICESINPFVIIMGPLGLTGLELLILGSTALTSIHKLKYPVMVVPIEAVYTPIKKIGLACDFEDAASYLPINFVKTLTKELHAQLHILNVENFRGQYGKTIENEIAELEGLLGNIVPVFHFLEAGDVTEGIINFSKKNELDILVTAPRKHNILGNLFQQTNTKRFLRHSHIPIIAAHK